MMRVTPLENGVLIYVGELCSVLDRSKCQKFWRLTDGSCTEWFPIDKIRILKD